MKMKSMGSGVIYYKLLCSSLVFFSPQYSCTAEELSEYSPRTTFEGNKEDKISQQCPLLFATLPEGLFGGGRVTCFEF